MVLMGTPLPRPHSMTSRGGLESSHGGSLYTPVIGKLQIWALSPDSQLTGITLTSQFGGKKGGQLQGA